ncbi:hypothetical protein N7478_007803 [Penicillium angulare]|uniref:uncharacterized protein n=1 Tax=Penicillium angulare TaxID=116970 RepID=UPI0025406AF7|nr:uncharacterized protein N7478_007803 [Penicillium angulare]KAJ5272678.1 hypothetical protein N7478_007803 [Penicillium angulare]
MPPGGGGGGGHLPPPGGPPEDGRMKRASTACKECQKRRTRCSGVPCSECQAHGRDCIFDELSDRRRKASAKKTQEELANLRLFFDQLLDVFRLSDGAAIQHMIEIIRSGASQDEIRAAVLQLLPQNAPSSHQLNPQVLNEHHDMGNFFEPH